MSSVTFPFRQSFHSIIAGAATGAGLAASVSTTCVSFGLQVELGPVGTPPTTAVVTLEGSCDGGTKWFTLGTWTLTPQASGDIVFVVDKPVSQVRANCTSLSGGTNGTVDAWISVG
ncbi:MAG TPA: hypothetical protein VN519_06710 [Bryobacteraceae bacterium]|nr:hypothetical protein [Bryobacteraceae bacterium]